MISCVMSIYGFYSTNLVLRRPETSATDKSHFCSFDAPSVFLSSFSVRRPIGFRPPSDRIPSAVQSDCVRRPIRFRPPPNRIPSAARSDSVRRPIRFRPPSNRIPSAVRRKSQKKRPI